MDIHQVTAEYFQALRIPLLKGRLLSATDRRDASRVVVLSESAAKKYVPEGDPLGAMVWVEPEKDMMVVGIVRDLRLDGPERPPRPETYIPLSQDIVTGADLVVRTTGDPLSMAAAVKSTIGPWNRAR